jgi:hypothetical protein
MVTETCHEEVVAGGPTDRVTGYARTAVERGVAEGDRVVIQCRQNLQ